MNYSSKIACQKAAEGGVAILVVFPDPESAEYPVAGIPAAARVIRAIAAASEGEAIPCRVDASASGWVPLPRCIAECERLSGSLTLSFGGGAGRPSGDVLVIDGVDILAQIAHHGEAGVRSFLEGAQLSDGSVGPSHDKADVRRTMREASRAILKATGKADDGIVSRYLNRPISRSITGLLLRHGGIRPIHATAGTALLAVFMVASLLLWGGAGAIAGALFFQAASIFDGVDGEMARATYRSSTQGAKLDSLIDAWTNLAFLAGLSFNLNSQGDKLAGIAGAGGMIMLAVGLFQIGLRAQALGQPINFEVVKIYLRSSSSRSPLTDIVIWLTMRDFIAAAAAVLIVTGHAHLILLAFSGCASIWLVVVTGVLVATRPAARKAVPSCNGPDPTDAADAG